MVHYLFCSVKLRTRTGDYVKICELLPSELSLILLSLLLSFYRRLLDLFYDLITMDCERYYYYGASSSLLLKIENLLIRY